MNLTLSQYQSEIALLEPFVKNADKLSDQQEQAIVSELLDKLNSVTKQLGVDEHAAFTAQEQRKLLRAALNVIPADTLSSASTTKLNRLLQSELLKKEIARSEELAAVPFFTLGSTKVVLWQGDITQLEVDAIVNAANSQMLGCFQPLHACIDNAIHSSAGVQLRDDCDKIIKMQGQLEETGSAKVTRAYNLPSKFVLHTVGPIVNGQLTESHEKALSSSYRSCLDICKEVDPVRSIAFCAISTGVFGYPIESATKTALESVTQWLKQNPDSLDVVVFNVFSKRDHQIYQEIMEEFVCQL
ncbi:protein-ADP-ribose hydrolase [Vibrio sp. JC009]|uniref:protein-ADP-ribose hydrolase n=1 Tax=Vibrio sp. JC009 TaxID=2912314 RepID=UPI0023B16586|nr:protein-ADP-ribose hydrolase [Vibrio sp. JC009]WED23756.1 protein-ADP-ribose hydrolase [Vibrio sp. JC009]